MDNPRAKHMLSQWLKTNNDCQKIQGEVYETQESIRHNNMDFKQAATNKKFIPHVDYWENSLTIIASKYPKTMDAMKEYRRKDKTSTSRISWGAKPVSYTHLTLPTTPYV